MQTIYCISGLGADQRVFSKLDCPGYEVHYIKWLIPLKEESIGDYAKRLIHQIRHPKPILIGVSFGGMMCIEIAKHIKVSGIILISSIKYDAEMPRWMRLSGKFKVNKLFKLRFMKFLEPIENYRLGLETKEERNMVHDYRKNVDRKFLNWSINAVLNWKNKDVPANTFHIHGSKDKIFPIRKIKPDHNIHGGHMMILNRSKEVNEVVNSILKKIG
jgi:pimeloyl-ACP methyl ester carboxylesterase